VGTEVTPARTPEKLRIVYFGMMGPFSCPPLQVLLAGGHNVTAIVVPGLRQSPGADPKVALSSRIEINKRYRMVPQLVPPSLDNVRQIARKEGIPILEAQSLHAVGIQAEISAYRPDALCVACFPWRLPAGVLDIPRLGSLNVHPSYLPDNRGPDPLFWTFKRGDATTGVTIHLMDESLDTGPILLQERVTVPDGISERALEEELANRGARLLAQALMGLASDRLKPVAQDSSQAIYYPLPTPLDWVITPDLPARRVYNFASGLQARTQPMLIQVEGRTFQLLEPLDFDEQADMGAAWRLDGQILVLSCAPGVFRARVALIPREQASLVQ
jgi:methionyl-tRNA formyltransferase